MSSPLDFTPPPLVDHRRRTPPFITSFLIITFILILVAVLTTLIHLLLRRRRSPSPLSPPSPPLPLLPDFVRHSTVSSTSAAPPSPPAAYRDAIASLPLFSLAAIPKSSPDCAVCLSPFRPLDQLRLLPACRHAFHATCIDTWLRSTPSCPLCRAPALSASAGSGSGSFRVAIGSISRREEADSASSAPPWSYSLGSSFEYVEEEEVEVVMERLRRRLEKEEKAEGAAAPPGDEVAEAAGGGSRGWLRDYVDRISSSSSLGSLRFSGRWSQRSDPASAAGGAGGERRRDSWEFEMEESGFGSFYRWLWGA